MAGRDRDRVSWVRHSSLGIEFAAALAGFALVGVWVDRHYGCAPWGLLVGAGLGIVGGGYNLIRSSMRAFRELEQTGGRDEEKGAKP